MQFLVSVLISAMLNDIYNSTVICVRFGIQLGMRSTQRMVFLRNSRSRYRTSECALDTSLFDRTQSLCPSLLFSVWGQSAKILHKSFLIVLIRVSHVKSFIELHTFLTYQLTPGEREDGTLYCLSDHLTVNDYWHQFVVYVQ